MEKIVSDVIKIIKGSKNEIEMGKGPLGLPTKFHYFHDRPCL